MDKDAQLILWEIFLNIAGYMGLLSQSKRSLCSSLLLSNAEAIAPWPRITKARTMSWALHLLLRCCNPLKHIHNQQSALSNYPQDPLLKTSTIIATIAIAHFCNKEASHDHALILSYSVKGITHKAISRNHTAFKRPQNSNCSIAQCLNRSLQVFKSA